MKREDWATQKVDKVKCGNAKSGFFLFPKQVAQLLRAERKSRDARARRIVRDHLPQGMPYTKQLILEKLK